MKSIDTLIEQRFSPKHFADRAVSEEQLHQLFEAARRAPSSFNEQPWRFIYATQEHPEAYQKLLSCISEHNQQWAKSAPVLMLSLAKKHFSRNEKPNRHAWHDTGTAIGFLLLKATEMDLYAHQMAGFNPEKAREVLGIPNEYDPVAMMAVGYLGEEENPNKLRKPVNEIAFTGNSHGLL
ncbi:MAG: nitroreductase family protein [Cyclobacteriaceae bacterium]